MPATRRNGGSAPVPAWSDGARAPACIALLPKVELHCHLDGIVDPGMLRELREQGHELPLSPEALETAYPVQGYDDFIRWFSIADAVNRDLDRFRPILALHIERLKAQRVVYTEIMIAGGEIPLHDKAEALQKLGEFRAWVNELEDGAIQVEFLTAFGKSRPPEVLEARADVALALYDAGIVVGFALAGPEAGYPVKPFVKTLARLHERGMGIEIHAGEWCGPESVWDALEHGHPHRIGHGLAIFDDPRLLDAVQERQIHIEMCPTSNVRFGSLCRRLEDHPIQKARDLGLSFSVNTDDPGASQCSMESEYELLADIFGFTEQDFARVYAHSLAARFQPRLRVPVSDPGLGKR
jgi:adenosine deaminase